MNHSRLPLQMMGLLGLFGSAAAAHAHESTEPPQPQSVEDLGTPVSSEKLADVRGGFDIGDGLQVSFGIERAIYVDGNLVTYTSVNIPDIAHITTQQAMALASALRTIDVQVGQGNTSNASSTTSKQSALGNVASNLSPSLQSNSVIPNSVGSFSTIPGMTTASSNTQPVAVLVSSALDASPMLQPNAATVIQNTVDNQIITSLTTLNVAVNTLNSMRTSGVQQALQAAQIQALAH